MLPAKALEIWSECCASGVSWYLYADALLCAEGYHAFPDTLKNAQIAVFAADFSYIAEQVFPKLPSDWILNTHLFATKKSAVCFTQGDLPVLEIHILSAQKKREDAEVFSTKVNMLRSNIRSNFLLLRILGKISSCLFNKWIERKKCQYDRTAFSKLLSLALDNEGESYYYCDHMTNKDGVTLPKTLFEKNEQLICDGNCYPVFSGYRIYLSEVYGDYETGLFDEIGCGLTDEEKADLKVHQQHCKEALGFVQRLSEEFGLRYYLLAGSVLGCVRHGGFIPWDDDIDLGIRIEDLAKFESVIKEYLPSRLPEEYKLVQSGPNNGYPRMFSKICYDGRCCLDLWPLVPTYTNGLRANVTWYFAKIITKVHYKKLHIRPTRFVKIVDLMSMLMTDRMVLWTARLNERKYQQHRTPAYINLYSIYRREKETIMRLWLDTDAKGNFDGITVPVVGCTQEYLTHLYGDYMAFPPPWKRASRHIDRF